MDRKGFLRRLATLAGAITLGGTELFDKELLRESIAFFPSRYITDATAWYIIGPGDPTNVQWVATGIQPGNYLLTVRPNVHCTISAAIEAITEERMLTSGPGSVTL